MTYGEPTRAMRRKLSRWVGVVGLLIVVATGCGDQVPTSGTSSDPRPTTGSVPHHMPLVRHSGALGKADGAVPDGTTVFDDDVPGVANLRPALLAALRQAAVTAENDRVQFSVDSGWRSAAYQQRLFDQAVAKYGSETEAARWVARPSSSEHVKGDAVDLGSQGAAWLSEHGAAYGLCQIYDNEPWHYELRPDAADHGCPARYPDAAHDPRMQK